ncbi:hypothetical protein PoB_001137500 [Plakobranchus ocellatus]|uniref:Uncharacterized protein n=1 Tax=Plakobranchus ocellatus TaxID=259542 RepID=A0AAV3YQ74_9GAST|nr:hypothetical protein PoB_001137500 [Plakobranchus ocellatus]
MQDYSWDPETKRQSAEYRVRNKPRPEKARRKEDSLKVKEHLCGHILKSKEVVIFGTKKTIKQLAKEPHVTAFDS